LQTDSRGGPCSMQPQSPGIPLHNYGSRLQPISHFQGAPGARAAASTTGAGMLTRGTGNDSRNEPALKGRLSASPTWNAPCGQHWRARATVGSAKSMPVTRHPRCDAAALRRPGPQATLSNRVPRTAPARLGYPVPSNCLNVSRSKAGDCIRGATWRRTRAR